MVETTATTDAELVERLRAKADECTPEACNLFHDAADRIVALSAEVERRERLGEAKAAMQLAQCRRQRDDLKAALEGLASYAASVWFDEATATDEEREAMQNAHAAISRLPSEPVPSPSGEEERKALEANAETVANWLVGIAELDFDEIAADGGVTSGMVVQQEARDMAARLRRNLSRLQEPR